MKGGYNIGKDMRQKEAPQEGNIMEKKKGDKEEEAREIVIKRA